MQRPHGRCTLPCGWLSSQTCCVRLRELPGPAASPASAGELQRACMFSCSSCVHNTLADHVRHVHTTHLLTATSAVFSRSCECQVGQHGTAQLCCAVFPRSTLCAHMHIHIQTPSHLPPPQHLDPSDVPPHGPLLLPSGRAGLPRCPALSRLPPCPPGPSRQQRGC